MPGYLSPFIPQKRRAGNRPLSGKEHCERHERDIRVLPEVAGVTFEITLPNGKRE